MADRAGRGGSRVSRLTGNSRGLGTDGRTATTRALRRNGALTRCARSRADVGADDRAIFPRVLTNVNGLFRAA